MTREGASRVAVSPFAFLEQPTDAPILIDGAAGREWTQQEVAETVDAIADRLRTGRKDLVFNFCTGIDMASVLGYLGAVRAGHAVAMLDGRVPAELTDALIERYSPAFVMRPGNGDHLPVIEESTPGGPPLADELQVLLSTSGTTGSPKLARLSARNIDAHGWQLAEYLEIDEHERAIQSLPVHFSYGLSILNSHLAAGASVILSPHSIMRPDFWTDAQRWGATSFAGVPYSYAILERTGLLRKMMPETLRTLTQSGARLAPEAITGLHEIMSAKGGRIFVMYGLTETTARISYVPPHMQPEKSHCVGRAIPDGHISILAADGEETTEPEVEGEVVFRGPNVMLGYAQKREDLGLGDELNGVCHTGDLGIIDSDGLLRLTGRTKRIAKVYGLRVNLDEVEAAAIAVSQGRETIAAADGGDHVALYRLPGAAVPADDLRRELARRFNLNSRAFSVDELPEFPLNGRGKVDYKALAELRAD
jgi:acyl-CoA synthetase (AMP-forming)/AMP-acid ligase II